MSEAVIIAIISAAGVVIAALVTSIFAYLSKQKKQHDGNSENGKNITIKQKQKGKGVNTQIGIQNITEGANKDE